MKILFRQVSRKVKCKKKNVLVKQEIELLTIYDFITILFSSRDDWLLSSLHRQGFIIALSILVLQLDKIVSLETKKKRFWQFLFCKISTCL